MKNKIVLGILCLLISLGIVFVRGNKLMAVTDSCYGVSTNFTATFPSSVTAGQSFSLTGITTQPSNSYNVTVNSSTLSLSGTNASESIYEKNNTSTNPSPTTGHSTYIAYYPDWSLKATGGAGSQIVVKLTKVTANTTEAGSISCPLSATLATINIVAPAGGGSGNTNNSPSTTNKTSAPTNTANQTATSQTASQEQAQKATLNVTVKDKNNHGVKGAKVTLDNQQTVTTDTEGTALFNDVVPGDHAVKVSYKNQTLEKTVSVDGVDPSSEVTVTLPIASELPYKRIIEIAAGVIVLAVIIWAALRFKSRFAGFKPVNSPGSANPSAVFAGDMSVTPPSEIVPTSPPAPNPPAAPLPVPTPAAVTPPPTAPITSVPAPQPITSVPVAPTPLPPAQPVPPTPAASQPITKFH